MRSTYGETPLSNCHTIAQPFSSPHHEGDAKPRDFGIRQEVPFEATHVPFTVPYEMHSESKLLMLHDAKTLSG
jgi:hypothetical protein